MLTFMAGATTTGPVKARYSVVRKSSARPWASLAIRSAVAGAIASTSFSCATRDVFDGAFDGEQIGEHLAPGERGEGQGPDELLRGRRS